MVEEIEKTEEVLDKVEDVKMDAPAEETKEKVPVEKKTKKATSKKAKETKPKSEKKDEAPKKEKKVAAPKKKKEAVEISKEKAEPEDKVEAPKKEKEVSDKVAEAPKEEKADVKKTSKKEKEVSDKVAEEADEGEKKSKSIRPKKDELPFPEELIFGKYNTSDVIVEDPSLKAHINLDPAYVPHSSARHANKPFYKAKISIVERLVNSIMRTGKYTGKKTKSYKAVLEAFELITNRTKENPVQILVRAIENSAPREEVTRLKFGGISVPKAVDAGPSRRLDIALRNISIGTVKSTHKNRKSIAVCLANEILAAANGDIQSYAVSKRDEVERVAKSAH